MAPANAASMNPRLVVLIVSFIKLLCDLVVYGPLGQWLVRPVLQKCYRSNDETRREFCFGWAMAALVTCYNE